MANKGKYTLQNLYNIVQGNNQYLIDYESKQITLGNSQIKNQPNKIQVDQNGELYVIKDGKKDYGYKKQKYGLMPNFCPICSKLMGKNKNDKFYWNIHKRCTKCSIKLQSEMKYNGTFNQFAINYMKNKLVDTCDLALQFYKEMKNQKQKDIMVNQHGTLQKWSIGDQKIFFENINKMKENVIQFKTKAIQYYQQKLNEKQD